MSALYLINSKKYYQTTIELFRKAAKKRKIKLIEITTEDFDFSDVPKLHVGDSLYRIATNPVSATIEKLLINSTVATLYADYQVCIGRRDGGVGSPLLHQKAGLPIIQTIFSLTSDKIRLKKYVRKLGGFPIIIKAVGGSSGIGVIRVDSFDALYSLSDYLLEKNDHKQYILRKYIEHSRQGRLIVLGDKVIASKYNTPVTDFRTNLADEIKEKKFVFPKDIQQIAIQAVHTLGFEFGAVDILFDKKTKKPYLAEVNFPCFFPNTQEITGIDIAGKIIDYLVTKSKT